MRSHLAVITSLLLGCAHPSTSPEGSTSTSRTCDDSGTSSLPGVCIVFATSEGTWTLAEAAAGISIPYEVIIETEVAKVVPMPQDAGRCTTPGPSGLMLFERLSGSDQEYCICDTGLCPQPDPTPVTLTAGRTSASFDWDGHNWQGPSDTSNPVGPTFAPGSYTLEVSARGTVDGAPFEVRNTFTVHLTP